MYTRREVTEERLVSRKGFIARFELKFFVLFPLLFLIVESMNEAGFSFAGYTIPPFMTIDNWLTSGLTVALFAFLTASLFETLFLNLTLLNYQEKATFLFFKDFVASFSAVGLFTMMSDQLQLLNNWSVVLCVLFVPIAGLKVKVIFIDLWAYVLLTMIFVLGHVHNYGIQVSNELTGFLLISFALYSAQWLLVKLVQMIFLRKKTLELKKIIGKGFISFMLSFSFILTYFVGLWIMEQYDFLQILSYKELFIMYVLYFVSGFLNFSLYWSKIRTEKTTRTYSYY